MRFFFGYAELMENMKFSEKSIDKYMETVVIYNHPKRKGYLKNARDR